MYQWNQMSQKSQRAGELSFYDYTCCGEDSDGFLKNARQAAQGMAPESSAPRRILCFLGVLGVSAVKASTLRKPWRESTRNLSGVGKRDTMRGMRQGMGTLTEMYLGGKAAGRVRCELGLVPLPGQYVLAHAVDRPEAALAVPLFSAGACTGGFLAAPGLPGDWHPGVQLKLRGPLGKGFQLQAGARRVALIAYGGSAARLLGLVEPALAQGAAVSLLAATPPEGLPAALEISPLTALPETLRWADSVFIDTSRALLPDVLKALAGQGYAGDGGVLVETPLPCGGLAECGACAVGAGKGYLLACEEGPVVDVRKLWTGGGQLRN